MADIRDLLDEIQEVAENGYKVEYRILVESMTEFILKIIEVETGIIVHEDGYDDLGECLVDGVKIAKRMIAKKCGKHEKLNIIQHDLINMLNKGSKTVFKHAYKKVGELKSQDDYFDWKEKFPTKSYEGLDGFEYPVFHLFTDKECKECNFKIENM